MAFVEILTVCNEYQINYQYIYQCISINTELEKIIFQHIISAKS